MQHIKKLVHALLGSLFCRMRRIRERERDMQIMEMYIYRLSIEREMSRYFFRIERDVRIHL